MTYVDDDDFDDVEAGDTDEVSRDEAGRCDECGLKVKKEDALQCHMCSAVYHRWCAGAECNVCKTPMEAKVATRAVPRGEKPRKKTKR